MKHMYYEVALTPPPRTWRERPDLTALYSGRTTLRVRVEVAEGAESDEVAQAQARARARVMIPWRLNPRFFGVDATPADRSRW